MRHLYQQIIDRSIDHCYRSALIVNILALAGGTSEFPLLRDEPRWKKGICKNEMQTLQYNFQPQRFFIDAWYDSQSIGSMLTSLYRRCATVRCVMTENGQINLTLSAYYPILFSTFSEHVTITLQNNRPEFNLTSQWINRPMSILSTDYDNYALVYSCIPKPLGLEGYISEMVFVFRRRRGDRSKGDVIRKAAWNNGIKYEEFSWHDEENC